VSGLPRRVDDDDPARRGLAAAALPPPAGNPSFATIMKVARALGLKLHFDSVA
jgi:DNA-binding phage protein